VTSTMSEHHQLPRLLGRFRGAFVSVGIFSMVFNLLMLTLPLYMLSIFTRVFSSKSDETLLLLTIVAFFALSIQGLLDLIRSRVMIRVGTALDAALTPQVLEAVVRDAAGTPSQNAQPLRDAGEVRSFFSGTGVFALFDAPFAPLYVAVIYLLHPMLGMIALGGAVALFLLAVMNEALTRKPLEQASRSSSKARARVDEFIRNSDAVEAMGMMPAIVDRWRDLNSDALHAQSQAADKGSISTSLAKSLRILLQISLFGAGAYLYIQNQILPGSIIAAAILMSRALAPVEQAISTWRVMVSAKAAYGRLREVLKPERLTANRKRTTLPRPQGRIDVERLVVMAPGSDRMILKGVSFELNAGEFLGVVGPSGAGKTTLGRVLVGILRPRGGAARLDGAELSTWHPDDLGQYVGYLPQDVQLFPGTVSENIARMARDFSDDEVLGAAKMAGAHEMILGLAEGYDTDIGEAGGILSAGQRQHIALARAFFGNPSLLVLDEPNSNLDSVSESALVRALATARDRNITIVVITHRPSILGAADKVLVLRDGNVDLYGPRDRVMARVSQAAIEQEQRKKISVVKENPSHSREGVGRPAFAETNVDGPAAASSTHTRQPRPRQKEAAGPKDRQSPRSKDATKPRPDKKAASRFLDDRGKSEDTRPSEAPEERLVETTIVRADGAVIKSDQAVVRNESK
jgi:PrtD family type I secretion system ABC transporter